MHDLRQRCFWIHLKLLTPPLRLDFFPEVPEYFWLFLLKHKKTSLLIIWWCCICSSPQITIPSVDKGTHGRRRANFCPCFVAFLPRTSSTRQSSASQGQKLTSFRLSDPDHRYFGNLQGGRLRRTGRTLIEDNAENYRNIMVQGVCALVHWG